MNLVITPFSKWVTHQTPSLRLIMKHGAFPTKLTVRPTPKLTFYAPVHFGAPGCAVTLTFILLDSFHLVILKLGKVKCHVLSWAVKRCNLPTLAKKMEVSRGAEREEAKTQTIVLNKQAERWNEDCVQTRPFYLAPYGRFSKLSQHYRGKQQSIGEYKHLTTVAKWSDEKN